MAKDEEIDREEEEKTPKAENEDEDEDEEGAKKKRRRKRKRSRKSKGDDGENEEDEESAKLVGDNSGPEDDTVRTVFVEGVPYDATPEQVSDCLQKHAVISRDDITDLRFPTWQDSGRMRGYGHVVFSSVAIFDKVMTVAKSGEKMWMGKRYLSLQPAKPKGMGLINAAAQQPANKEPTTTIMVKNLDYSATEDDIIQVMEQYGPIIDGGVRIARNFHTRQNKGFAYVEYADLKSSKKAMEGQKKNPNKPICILKRPCLLDYDDGRIKGSFKTASGRLWSKEHKQQKPAHKQSRRS